VGFSASLYATVDGFDRVRFCPHNGLKSDIEPCLKSADFVAEIGVQTARDGWCIFEAIHCHPLDCAGTYARLY
jgi:hypothetical protein